MKITKSLCTLLLLGASLPGSAQVTPDRHRMFVGTVPLDSLSPSALERFFSFVSTRPEELSIDAGWAVFLHEGCGERVTPEQAIRAARAVFVRDPGPYTGFRLEPVPGKPGQLMSTLGQAEIFCGEAPTDPPGTIVVVQARNAETSSYEYLPYIVSDIDTSPSVKLCYRDPGTSSQLGWSDMWEYPDYLGFLRHKGEAWAFAVVDGGAHLVVFDLHGHVVVDQESWGSPHLVRDGDNVVLYAILIEKAPKSAVELMPGKDEMAKRDMLSEYRTWTLRKIGEGSNEVITSALVPKSKGRYDDNPEIRKRSEPIVKKAEQLFDGFRKEGRIVNQLP